MFLLSANSRVFRTFYLFVDLIMKMFCSTLGGGIFEGPLYDSDDAISRNPDETIVVHYTHTHMLLHTLYAHSVGGRCYSAYTRM